MFEFFGQNPEMKPFFGVVEDIINDPMKLGRARVRIFGYHPVDKTQVPTLDLPWSTVLTPTTSASVSGIGEPPQLVPGSWVFGFFLDGAKAQQPMVIGTLPGQHAQNPPGYGGTATPNSQSGTGGSSETDANEPRTQHNAIRDSANIRNDGTYLTARDASAVNIRNYRLSDFGVGSSPGQGSNYANPRFRFHKATAFALDTVSTNMGRKLNINSGWRTWGDPKRHPLGHAVDISIRGMSPSDVYRMLNLAAQAGFTNFGIEWTYIHMDTTNHMPATLYAYPHQGARSGSGSAFDGRQTTGNLRHSEILRALQSAGWVRGRTRPFQLVRPNANRQATPENESVTPLPAPQSMSGPQASGASSNESQRIGFRDPTNTYPLNNYRGSSSIAIEARGVADNVGGQNSMERETGRVVNFPLPFESASFGEPAIPAASQYTYNHVRKDRSGNMIEMDATPNAERVNIAHRKGSYVEFGPEGDVVSKSTGDMTNISAGNLYQGTKGNYGVSAAADIGFKSGTNFTVHADGNMGLISRGHINQQVNGDYNLRVGGDMRVRGRKLYLEFEEIHLVASGDIFITANEGNIQVYSGKELSALTKEGANLKVGKALNIQTGEALNVKVAKAMNVQSEEDFSVKSAKGVKLQSGESIDLKSGQKINLESEGAMNVKGKSTVKISSDGNISAVGAVTESTPPWVAGGSAADGASSANSATEATEAKKGKASDLPATQEVEPANINNRPRTARPVTNNPTTVEAAQRAGGGGSGSGGGSYTGDVNDRNARYSGPQNASTNSNPNATQGRPSARAQEAYDYYISQGYSPEFSAAMVGNIQHESNFNTGAIGDRGTAFGIVQWRGDRQDALRRFAAERGASPTDFRTQLEFSNAELRGTAGTNDPQTRRVLGLSSQLNDSRAISNLLDSQFFRSDGRARGSRANNAEQIFNQQQSNPQNQNSSGAQEANLEGPGFDTPQRSISPVRERQQTEKNKKYNILMTSGEGVKNYVNTAPIREAGAKFRIKAAPSDESISEVWKAAQKTGYPVDMLLLLESWNGDGKSLSPSEGSATEIAEKQIKDYPEMEKGIETYPTRAEMYMAFELDTEDAIKLIKNSKDKAKKDEEADVGEEDHKKKDSGPNINENRSWIELYNYYASRIVNGGGQINVTSARAEDTLDTMSA